MVLPNKERRVSCAVVGTRFALRCSAVLNASGSSFMPFVCCLRRIRPSNTNRGRTGISSLFGLVSNFFSL